VHLRTKRLRKKAEKERESYEDTVARENIVVAYKERNKGEPE